MGRKERFLKQKIEISPDYVENTIKVLSTDMNNPNAFAISCAIGDRTVGFILIKPTPSETNIPDWKCGWLRYMSVDLTLDFKVRAHIKESLVSMFKNFAVEHDRVLYGYNHAKVDSRLIQFYQVDPSFSFM